MTWVATAVIGGSVVSGLLGSRAASKAAGVETAAAGMGIDETRRQFDLTREDFAPYREVGERGLYTLEDYLGLSTPESRLARTGVLAPTREQFTTAGTPGAYRWGGMTAAGLGPRTFTPGTPARFDEAGYNTALADYLRASEGAEATSEGYGSLLERFTGEDLTSEPGYEFGLSEGEKAIDRSARGRGSFDSGATLKALLRYGTDYAGTKYNEAFNRDAASKSSIYNMLAGITGTGQTATGQVATAGSNASTNIANLLGQQGDARAAGIVGGANAWNQAVSGGLEGYQNMTLLDMLKNQNTGTSTGGGAYDWSRYR